MNGKVTRATLSPAEVARQAQRIQANQEELVERIMRGISVDGSVELLKGIRLHRSSVPTEPIPRAWEPALGVIAQGSKEFYCAAIHLN